MPVLWSMVRTRSPLQYCDPLGSITGMSNDVTPAHCIFSRLTHRVEPEAKVIVARSTTRSDPAESMLTQRCGAPAAAAIAGASYGGAAQAPARIAASAITGRFGAFDSIPTASFIASG